MSKNKLTPLKNTRLKQNSPLVPSYGLFDFLSRSPLRFLPHSLPRDLLFPSHCTRRQANDQMKIRGGWDLPEKIEMHMCF